MFEDDSDPEPSDQLCGELKQSVIAASQGSRPLLFHVNADTTWLLSFAYPRHAKSPPGRGRFNLLIDPWLQGPQSDVAGWFSTQWHAIESSVKTIAELNGVLGETELVRSSTSQGPKPKGQIQSNGVGNPNFLDAVVLSHEFTDHCHQATLQEIDQRVPVFATQKAAALVRSWHHFENVFDITAFSSGMNWKTTSTKPLPSWLGISRLVTKQDALYYHSAIIFCIEDRADSSKAEAIIYTPHGIESESFSVLISAKPPVKTLALMHGLHDVSIAPGKQLNLGAHNALKAQRKLQPKYWVGTHDEIKRGGGLVSLLLRRRPYTLLDALSRETARRSSETVLNGKGGAPNYCELASGESMLLE